MSEGERTAAMRQLRDEYAASRTDNPAAVSVGYNPETNQFAAGASHCDGVCAEVCVANQLGSDPSKIQFLFCRRSPNSPGLRSRNSPGLARRVMLLGLRGGLGDRGAGPFVGSVAGSVHEDLVAGVDQSVQ